MSLVSGGTVQFNKSADFSLKANVSTGYIDLTLSVAPGIRVNVASARVTVNITKIEQRSSESSYVLLDPPTNTSYDISGEECYFYATNNNDIACECNIDFYDKNYNVYGSTVESIPAYTSSQIIFPLNSSGEFEQGHYCEAFFHTTVSGYDSTSEVVVV